MVIFKNDYFSIKFLGVLCGDAILVRVFGNDKKYHNIMIDSGFVKTYKSVLKPALVEIKESDEKIDLIVGTHYDGDHIGGRCYLAKKHHLFTMSGLERDSNF